MSIARIVISREISTFLLVQKWMITLAPTAGTRRLGRASTLILAPSRPIIHNIAMENQNTYSLDATCKNCNFEGSVQIPKGKTLDEIDCPTCGNKKSLVQKPKTGTYYKIR